MAKLGDVCEISSSKMPIPDGKIWLLNLDAVESQTGNILFYNYVTKKELKGSVIQFDTNNVLYSKLRPNLNKVVIPSQNGFATSEMLPLRPKENIICKEYLAAYLRSHSFVLWAESKTAGAKMPRLGTKALLEKEIPVPPLEEQRRIVAVLDKVTDLIAQRRAQLDKLDLLVKSRFAELFMWKGYPLKTVDEVSLGKGEYGAQSASTAYNPNRPRYVRITDINDDGTLNNDVVASINPDDDEQYRLIYGDFLFARMGATVGKTYAFIGGNQIFAGYLIRYRLNQEIINPRYLFWFTKTDEYWNWVKLNQSGAAQPGINAKKYGSLRLPVPPIEYQNTFASFIEQVEKSKLTIRKSLDKLEILRQSIMQRYFK